MAPTALDGTVAANNAVGLSLNADKVNAVRWMLEDEKGLLIGTSGAEWRLGADNVNSSFSATNARAGRVETSGSASVRALKVSKSAVFVQASGRRLYDLKYTFSIDGFKSDEITGLSSHITVGGITALELQSQPYQFVWAIRADGKLLSLTYTSGEQNITAGWAKHTLGGYSDAGKTVAAIVESIAVIPSPDGTREDLWMVVNRYINGGTKRYIEYMTPWFTDSVTQVNAFFVDCGLTYSGAPVSSVSGLTHLEGQTVSVLGDGMAQANKVVSAGAITLDQAASVVSVGLPYVSQARTLRLEAGAADGTSIGKTRRVNRVGFLLHRSLGMSQGPSYTNLSPVIFRTTGDLLGVATPLYTGIVSETFEGDYDNEGYICVQQDQPLPSMILAIMPQMLEYDR